MSGKDHIRALLSNLKQNPPKFKSLIPTTPRPQTERQRSICPPLPGAAKMLQPRGGFKALSRDGAEKTIKKKCLKPPFFSPPGLRMPEQLSIADRGALFPPARWRFSGGRGIPVASRWGWGCSQNPPSPAGTASLQLRDQNIRILSVFLDGSGAIRGCRRVGMEGEALWG